MNYILEVAAAIPLPFLCYAISERAMRYSSSKEVVHEITKTFSLESLMQSVAIGIRDESTLVSLIDGLTRIEKTLTAKDREEMKEICSGLQHPESLKKIINDIISSINMETQIEKSREMFGNGDKSYFPTSIDLEKATEELKENACRLFEDRKFRSVVLEIRKRNAQLTNMYIFEEAAKEKSQSIVFKFSSFIESHKKDIPVIKSILNNTNGHQKFGDDEIKIISKELRKPPYEISLDEVWGAYHRLDSSKVKPLGEQKDPVNIIQLVRYAAGKIDRLEPITDEKLDE